MKSRIFEKLNLRLSCNDMYPTIRECAEQCYFKDKSGVGCLGFIKNKTTNICYICDPAPTSDIMVSNIIELNNNHLVYILKYKKKKPVMYLSLDRETVRGTTVKGEGVNGTLIKKENTQIQAGKVNHGLHFRNGGRLVLENTIDKCIQNLAACTNGLSIALWINPSIFRNLRHITHSEHSINIVATTSGAIGVWTRGQPNSLTSLVTQSEILVGTWTYVAVVFNPDVGMFIYMDGRLDVFKSIDEAYPHRTSNGPLDYVFGSKVDGQYPFDGALDEIKVYYKSLTCTGNFT